MSAQRRVAARARSCGQPFDTGDGTGTHGDTSRDRDATLVSHSWVVVQTTDHLAGCPEIARHPGQTPSVIVD